LNLFRLSAVSAYGLIIKSKNQSAKLKARKNKLLIERVNNLEELIINIVGLAFLLAFLALFFLGIPYLIWVRGFKTTEMDFSLNDGEEIIRWAPALCNEDARPRAEPTLGLFLQTSGTLYVTNKRILFCKYVAKNYGSGRPDKNSTFKEKYKISKTHAETSAEISANSDLTWWFEFTRAKIIFFEYAIGTPAEFNFSESGILSRPEFHIRKPDGEEIHIKVLRREKAMAVAVSEALKKIASA